MSKPISTSVPDLVKGAPTPTGSQEGQKTVYGDMSGFNPVQSWDIAGVEDLQADTARELY